MQQIHANEKEYLLASNILSIGADYANMSGAHYTRILFLLSKGMTLMIDRRLTEVHPVLSLAGQLVETWNGNLQMKEALKVYFLVLQVCFCDLQIVLFLQPPKSLEVSKVSVVAS